MDPVVKPQDDGGYLQGRTGLLRRFASRNDIPYLNGIGFRIQPVTYFPIESIMPLRMVFQRKAKNESLDSLRYSTSPIRTELSFFGWFLE